MAKKKFLPAKVSDVKAVPWNKVAPKSVFPLGRGSRAGVILNRDGAPSLFIFDTSALLDVLSEIDDKLSDRLSGEEYHSKSINPAGWLIDEIESKLPVNSKYAKSLKSAVAEAKRKGWIPFEKIEKELELVS